MGGDFFLARVLQTLYLGKQVKCRSNCEDQINSLFVTTSSYPNRKTLIYREEFCILAKNLLQKCQGPKKKPLEREYPNLCSIIQPLTQLDPEKFCKNNAWDIPRSHLPNCNNRKCPMEDAILGKIYIIESSLFSPTVG